MPGTPQDWAIHAGFFFYMMFLSDNIKLKDSQRLLSYSNKSLFTVVI